MSASAESGLGRQLESFREGCRGLEEAVLPLATSVDGRRFSFQASLHDLEFQIGGYVVLDSDGDPRLGQVLTLELDQLSTELVLPGGSDNRAQMAIRYARGEGTILDGDGAPFHDALVRVATGTDVQGWLQHGQRRYAQLRLGELALSPGVPCLADASGFNRHTFLCGQSGSGKTYSLGVILERLLMEPDLRMVVLDPNSDFVRLGIARDGAESDRPDVRRLGLRIRNLDIERFTVWAPGEAGSVLDAVHDQSVRCVVVDLGSPPTREEQSLVAAAVLSDLWRRRQERSPILIVIDEAHNICPAQPPNELVAKAAEDTIRIAAEGRKFGLYLLASTQRPQKIAENVLSQADNLVLMRMNSLADTAFAEAAFSFVPPSLIERAVVFRQGEALVAGKISPQPALLRFGARITEEGGADVPATWAAVR